MPSAKWAASDQQAAGLLARPQIGAFQSDSQRLDTKMPASGCPGRHRLFRCLGARRAAPGPRRGMPRLDRLPQVRTL